MEKNTYTVNFVIYGHDNVQLLSEELGIKPDKALNKGEPLFPGAGPIPRSMWELKSSLPSESEVEQHIEHLLTVLRPSKSQIAELSKSLKIAIVIGANYSESNPEIELTPNILAEIGELGAHLWLDMYFSGAENE